MQKQLNLPCIVKVNWKLWFVSRMGDSKALPSLVTVCGISSLFVQRQWRLLCQISIYVRPSRQGRSLH